MHEDAFVSIIYSSNATVISEELEEKTLFQKPCTLITIHIQFKYNANLLKMEWNY